MLVWLGLLVGIPLGVVLERGGFCMHSAFRESLSARPGPSTRAYLLALALQLALVNLLGGLGILEVPPLPVHPLAAALGGIAFGLGMVLAKG
jgi:uncharacterized membrane protein YedE/YeeE